MRATFNTRLGGSEIALYGFHLELLDVVAITDGDLQQIVDKVRDTWLDVMPTAKTYWSQAVVWESVRLDLLNNEAGPRYGKVLTSVFAPFASSGANSYAGTGGNSLPWSSSAVVSMAAYAPGQFEVNKGRWRGRYYLPPFIAGLPGGPTGEIPEGSLNPLADMLGEFHETLNDEVSDTLPNQLQLVVLSTSDDTVRRVRQVWMDSKLDTQRRRENRQPATLKRTVVLDP